MYQYMFRPRFVEIQVKIRFVQALKYPVRSADRSVTAPATLQQPSVVPRRNSHPRRVPIGCLVLVSHIRIKSKLYEKSATAIVAELGGLHTVLMALRRLSDLLAASKVPQPHRFVVTRSGNHLAVRAEIHLVHFVVVPSEGLAALLSIRSVNNPYCFAGGDG